jgi:hypothetical protein
MKIIEILPIFATICLILGDVGQLGRVLKSNHCRSVSLIKWNLSIIANFVMPIYYGIQQQYTSMFVAIFLSIICSSIVIIILIKRRSSKVSTENTMPCDTCAVYYNCEFAFLEYNTNGCIQSKVDKISKNLSRLKYNKCKTVRRYR